MAAAHILGAEHKGIGELTAGLAAGKAGRVVVAFEYAHIPAAFTQKTIVERITQQSEVGVAVTESQRVRVVELYAVDAALYALANLLPLGVSVWL